MSRITTREVHFHDDQVSTRLNIIIRNMSGITIRNARVVIESDVPITSDMRSTADSPSQISVDIPQIPPYVNAGDQKIVPIQMAVPTNFIKAGVLVSISGDHLQRYAAGANNIIVRDSKTL